MSTLPGQCAHCWDGQVARWRGDCSCCYRGIPQSFPKGLVLFGKILLLNPGAPSVQGRVCPLPQSTSPARLGPSAQGPTRPNSQLTPGGAQGLGGFTISSLFPSLGLQATRSLMVLLKPCWVWGCSCPGPCVCPRDLFVLK